MFNIARKIYPNILGSQAEIAVWTERRQAVDTVQDHSALAFNRWLVRLGFAVCGCVASSWLQDNYPGD